MCLFPAIFHEFLMSSFSTLVILLHMYSSRLMYFIHVDALKKRKTKWDMSMGVSESTGSKSAGSSPNKESTNNKSMPVGAQALVNARMISKTDMLKLMKK